ncbi:GATA transcription factor 26-like protein [Hibiscus syriacus]|uniref:GATA transcription factor 26-like protein n=1 Tax=Hibiscus syriacus TaxID=106335 RepID=A0A6A2ZIF2_HIBSY|nr:GATA transcription factor 26-like protein [Hibiscus syriacus]
MADATDPFPDLRSVYKVSSRQVNRLIRNVADMKLASAQDGDKEDSLESDNKVAASFGFSRDSTPNVWGHPNVIQKLRMQSNRGSEKATDKAWSTQNAVSWKQQGDKTWGNSGIKSPSSEHGKNDPDQAGSALTNSSHDGQIKPDHDAGDILDDENGDNEYDDDKNGVLYDSDDIDDYVSDSDDEKSHEARKKSKWFNLFFESLEKLTVEEILSPVRRWHCPACQGGPGAINWRGAFIKPDNAAFGKWEGLTDRVADREIVWPPMVVIMNTRSEQDENGKWIGMGNQELLNYFSSYAAVKARHSYGPQGHRGMSVLIFDSSAAGYLEAARLHKHFKEQGRDRDASDCSRALFCPGGKRQLYGYIAMKEDLDLFNRHSQGKSGLKFEMRSYQEMVESQIKKINNDSQQLNLLKKKLLKNSSTHKEAELRVTLRSQFGGCLFLALILIHILLAIQFKEDNFEKLLRAARERVKQSTENPKNNEYKHSATEMKITTQEKTMEEFEAEREKLMKTHQDRRLAITQRYWEELIELEEGFEKELTLLMGKYNPDHPGEETTDSHKGQDKKGTTDIETE